MSIRKIKAINLARFREDIVDSDLCNTESSHVNLNDLEGLASLYCNTLSVIVTPRLSIKQLPFAHRYRGLMTILKRPSVREETLKGNGA